MRRDVIRLEEWANRLLNPERTAATVVFVVADDDTDSEASNDNGNVLPAGEVHRRLSSGALKPGDLLIVEDTRV